jgi:protein involved in polysaccharide export with SLBB domain
MKRIRTLSIIALLAIAACGCSGGKPGNTVNLNTPDAYMLERQDMPEAINPTPGAAVRGNEKRCAPMLPPVSTVAHAVPRLPLSPGDLVRAAMPGDDTLTGNYKVDSDGTISFPEVGK